MSFYHAGTLFSPGESERRVSRPLAVQSDVCVHIHCNRPGLHYQYGANWKKIAIRSPNEQQKGSYQSQSQIYLPVYSSFHTKQFNVLYKDKKQKALGQNKNTIITLIFYVKGTITK